MFCRYNLVTALVCVFCCTRRMTVLQVWAEVEEENRRLKALERTHLKSASSVTVQA